MTVRPTAICMAICMCVARAVVSRAGFPLTHRRSTRQATFWAAALPPRMPRPRTQPLPLLPRPTPCNSRCVPSRRLWHRRSRRKPRVLRTAQHICSPSDGTISFCCTSNAAPVSPYPPNHQRMPQRITPTYVRTDLPPSSQRSSAGPRKPAAAARHKERAAGQDTNVMIRRKHAQPATPHPWLNADVSLAAAVLAVPTLLNILWILSTRVSTTVVQPCSHTGPSPGVGP